MATTDKANKDVPEKNDDDSTVFATADPTTIDRADDGSYNAIDEVNRLREQIINAPGPGEDPDSRKRLGKTLAAAGEDVPDHLQVGDSYNTDSDKLKDAGIPDQDSDGNLNPHADVDPKAEAAGKRSAAGTRSTSAPTGRSATPKA